MPPVGVSAAEDLSRRQLIGPILALLLLSPIISEVLYGATRLSTIFVLIPEILTWGCGALLIRECIRRWNKGWPSMLVMGIALAVAEEWIIQQTSIAPMVGLAKLAYGRVWGVNWVYFFWAVGYESVWVVLVPVQLTELPFPVRRSQTWLRTRGMVITSIVFVLGAFMAWYGWTQRARVLIFHMPPYNPPSLSLLAVRSPSLSSYSPHKHGRHGTEGLAQHHRHGPSELPPPSWQLRGPPTYYWATDLSPLLPINSR